MSGRKRETQGQRDQRIVGEAGPWVVKPAEPIKDGWHGTTPSRYGDWFSFNDAIDALTRIANRIHRERNGKS